MVLLVLHILLVGLNTALSIMNFKNGERLLGALWAITVPLWMMHVAMDIIELS
jgi:hypothetical protein